jgi:ubiquitin-protein ligase E3 C
LISGASDGKIDVEDMRSHTCYVGGYSVLDRNVNRFWSVVASLDSKQQAALLRFVTSCERPPPLGFGSMQPSPFSAWVFCEMEQAAFVIHLFPMY